MFKNQLKTAWRSLAKNKGYAFINILGLSIGLTLCLAVYLVTSFELSFDAFQPGKERIYRVVSEFQKPDGETQYLSMAPDPMAPAVRKSFTGIETVAQFHNFYAKVSVTADSGTKIFDAAREKETPSGIILTDPEYFDIFKYQWLSGNSNALRAPHQVVLTASEAKKYFGNLPYGQLTGRLITYNDSLACTVAGVVKDSPANSTFVFTDFISAATIPVTFLKNTYDLGSWENWASESQTFVRLREGVSPAQFDRQSRTLIKLMNTDPAQKTTIRLQSLADLHFDARFQDRYSNSISKSVLYTLMAISAFVLLIAAVNFINLSTAQSVKRAKEIGIRKVLGGSRRSLVIQFLTEALFVTVLSAAVAVLLAPLMLTVLRPFMPGEMPLHIDITTVMFTLAVIIVTALLAGLYPAKVLSGFAPAAGMKGVARQEGSAGSYLRQGLIVFQFTISILLITAAIIMGRQVHYALGADMGFAKTAIVNIPVNPASGTGKMTVLAQLIRQQNGVEMVSVDMGTPFQNSFRGTSLRCPALGTPAVDAQFQTGDENYLKLYKMKLLDGRSLLPSDTMREFVINETCAKKLGFTSPADAIGKMLRAGTTDGKPIKKLFRVVGVIADFHAQSFHQEIAPVFISTSKDFSEMISVKLSLQDHGLANLRRTIAPIEQDWKNVYPYENFHWSFFEDTIANFYAKETQAAQLGDTATTMAVLISCMGLLGLAAYTTAQRRKEISIRKVLGATSSNIMTLLSAEILKLVVIAAVIASPFAWLATDNWLQGFAYRIPLSWWFFVQAGLFGLLIALLTIGYQALKAAVANPVKNLRAE